MSTCNLGMGSKKGSDQTLPDIPNERDPTLASRLNFGHCIHPLHATPGGSLLVTNTRELSYYYVNCRQFSTCHKYTSTKPWNQYIISRSKTKYPRSNLLSVASRRCLMERATLTENPFMGWAILFNLQDLKRSNAHRGRIFTHPRWSRTSVTVLRQVSNQKTRKCNDSTNIDILLVFSYY